MEWSTTTDQCVLVVSPYRNEKRLAALDAAGFQLITASDGEEGMRKLYEHRPGVVVMTDDLAPVWGRDLHLRLRDISTVPCIILGDKDDVGRAMMIEEGADAYLDSHVRHRALIAHIRALIKRYNSGAGGPMFHPKRKEVQLGESTTRLTATEFRLLSCFAFSPGKVLPYPRLLAEVWGKDATLETVHLYVRRLKQKLGIDSVGPYRLLNYRGEGYCFCAGAAVAS